MNAIAIVVMLLMSYAAYSAGVKWSVYDLTKEVILPMVPATRGNPSEKRDFEKQCEQAARKSFTYARVFFFIWVALLTVSIVALYNWM